MQGLKGGRLARGRVWSDSGRAQAVFARSASSPGHFDVPCRARLPVSPWAELCNSLLRSLTGHPPSSKTLLLVTPGIKQTCRDHQMLPSSCSRFRAFKNQVERKWRAWVFCCFCQWMLVWSQVCCRVGSDVGAAKNVMVWADFVLEQCPGEAHSGSQILQHKH